MKDIMKRDTEVNWLKAKNFIPKENEIIIYDYDTGPKVKIGDGIHNVNDLPFKESTIVYSGKVENDKLIIGEE